MSPASPFSKPPENPYLAARREWNERYADHLRAKRNWQIIAFSAVSTVAILSVGLVWLASQSRVTPYIVEVDELGSSITIGPAESAHLTDDRILRYQLIQLIRNVRSIVADPVAEKQLLDQAYAYTRGAATQFLNEHFRDSNPFERMHDGTRSVEVKSLLPLSADTWQIDWAETWRSPDGRIVDRSRWQAVLTVEVEAPTRADEISRNPLGLYVTHLTWTSQL